jgi:HAD superfamily phosphatase (TIGR01668 family)
VKAVLHHFNPRLRVKTVYDIPLAELWDNGIRGIITDLDNTLVGAKEPLATPELIVWLEQVKAAGFKVVIVSNNNESRVKSFADPLQIPYIHRAKKPSNAAFHKALQWMGLTAEKTVVIGDQMLTDVLGGNRMGLHTILVLPIALLDEGFFTKINRRIEKILLAMMR